MTVAGGGVPTIMPPPHGGGARPSRQWTEAEDRILREETQRLGKNAWHLIVPLLPGRTKFALKQHYYKITALPNPSRSRLHQHEEYLHIGSCNGGPIAAVAAVAGAAPPSQLSNTSNSVSSASSSFAAASSVAAGTGRLTVTTCRFAALLTVTDELLSSISPPPLPSPPSMPPSSPSSGLTEPPPPPPPSGLPEPPQVQHRLRLPLQQQLQQQTRLLLPLPGLPKSKQAAEVDRVKFFELKPEEAELCKEQTPGWSMLAEKPRHVATPTSLTSEEEEEENQEIEEEKKPSVKSKGTKRSSTPAPNTKQRKCSRCCACKQKKPKYACLDMQPSSEAAGPTSKRSCRELEEPSPLLEVQLGLENVSSISSVVRFT